MYDMNLPLPFSSFQFPSFIHTQKRNPQTHLKLSDKQAKSTSFLIIAEWMGGGRATKEMLNLHGLCHTQIKL